jgi:hypothetical protein
MYKIESVDDLNKVEQCLMAGVKLKHSEDIFAQLRIQLSIDPMGIHYDADFQHFYIFAKEKQGKSIQDRKDTPEGSFVLFAFYKQAENFSLELKMYFGKIDPKWSKNILNKIGELEIIPGESPHRYLHGVEYLLAINDSDGKFKKWRGFFENDWEPLKKLCTEIKNYIIDRKFNGKMSEVPWDFDGKNIIADLTSVI